MMAVDALRARFEAGDGRALARALTWVEGSDPRGVELLRVVRRRAARGRLIGLTGAPGSGKSTLADALIGAWRERGWRVAVLAIDPSSPYSGGALLGDRLRMTRWAGDPGVFIRSMASRGQAGGLAPASLDSLAVLQAFGFDVVLVETVGVGQAELDVAAVADTTVVAISPGQGDDVQAAKAGLLEIADVFVLTKADRPGAERLTREMRDSLALPAGAGGLGDHPGGRAPVIWRPPLVPTAVGVPPAERPPVLAADGGLDALLTTLDAHVDHLAASGEGHERAKARVRLQVAWRARSALDAAIARVPSEDWDAVARGDDAIDALAARLLQRAREALAGLRQARCGDSASPDDADC